MTDALRFAEVSQDGLPDKRQVAASFSRAAASYDAVAELQRTGDQVSGQGDADRDRQHGQGGSCFRSRHAHGLAASDAASDT